MLQMGNCFHSMANNNKEIIISVVGLDDSGKSTTVKVLKGEKDIKDVTPTVGYEPHEIKFNAKNLVIYDLGGGARVRDIWKHYLAESYGFIYVIDSSNRNRVNEARSVFASFVENEKVAGKPILILGNKQDEPNALDESEIVQYLNVEELVNKFQIPCRVETCIALSGIGNKIDKSLKTGFEWLFKLITSQYDELKNRIDQDVQRQKSEESRIRKEKSEKLRQKRDNEYSNYYDDDDGKMNESPWKPLNDLKKDTKSKSSTSSSNEPKLSAYERQLIDDMHLSNRQKLTTIDEEKSKLKNRLLKSNKLSPYDDNKTDSDPYSKGGQASWAITGANSKRYNF